MKKIVFLLLLVMAGTLVQSQEYRKDTAAVMAFDRMSNLIGDLESCSFQLMVSYDVIDIELGLVKYFNNHKVYMEGPDKMVVQSKGKKGHHGFWYSGTNLTYYSYTENNFAVIEVPDNIIATIDTVNKRYGVDFPAADFFYPTFTDDMIENFDDLIYAGIVETEGKSCHHIIAKNPSMGVQFWLSTDEWPLPSKFVIVYYDQDPNMQYQGTFFDWKLNPDFPSSMFEFIPPPDANELRMQPK
jgi:hypothetical protein